MRTGIRKTKSSRNSTPLSARPSPLSVGPSLASPPTQRQQREQNYDSIPGSVANFEFGNIPVLSPTAAAIQRKLTIGQPNDKYEQEADRIADRIMRTPAPVVQAISENEGDRRASVMRHAQPLTHQILPLVQRQTGQEPDENDEEQLQANQEKGTVQRQESEEEEEKEDKINIIQTKANPAQASVASPGLTSQLNDLHGGGKSLPPTSRAFFEPRFMNDFSRVRIHDNNRAAEAAKSVNARAFTVGYDIAFAKGEYQPDTASGKKLLAHELTHVVQQKGQSNINNAIEPKTVQQKLVVNRMPNEYLARAASPKEISVTDKGTGALAYPLGSIVSPSKVQYRYGLKWVVDGNIKDADLGTEISSLMEDWSSSKVDYYIDIKKTTKAKYDNATTAWTANKEKFHTDYNKDKLVGASAANYIVESGNTWVKLADGPGGPVASWATGALVRYTVKAWLKGTDGKELLLRFWASLWAERDKPGDSFKVGHVTTHNIPRSVKAK